MCAVENFFKKNTKTFSDAFGIVSLSLLLEHFGSFAIGNHIEIGAFLPVPPKTQSHREMPWLRPQVLVKNTG